MLWWSSNIKKEKHIYRAIPSFIMWSYGREEIEGNIKGRTYHWLGLFTV